MPDPDAVGGLGRTIPAALDDDGNLLTFFRWNEGRDR
jgi:hypothetical protein